MAEVRNEIVSRLVKTGRMPSLPELAAGLEGSEDTLREQLQQLQQEQALLLDKQGKIRMLWPFSGVPTPFQVTAGTRSYWANCAFDSLGIAAALHKDAVIHASFAHPKAPVTLRVEDDNVTPEGCLVHFPVPASRWHENWAHT